MNTRVGQAVMRVVERADRMRQRVDGAEPLLEGGRAHRGGRHHVRARLDVRCRPCTARGRFSLTSRMPSTAMPSAIG